MRIFLQLALFVLLAAVCFFCFVKFFKRHNRKIKIVLSCLVSAVTVFVLSLFSFENLFLRFDVPEDLFRYLSWNTLEGIAYGEDSCMVVYRSADGSYSQTLFPKENGKYKLPQGSFTKKVSNSFVKGGSVSVYRAAGTDDYYVTGVRTISPGENEEIKDNRNSKFEVRTNETGVAEYKTSMFWAYLADFDSDYTITTNGVETAIADGR